MQLALLCDDPCDQSKLDQLAERWGLQHDDTQPFALILTGDRLALHYRPEPKLGAIFVELVEGASAHRRKFGGGRGQAIAKAVGLKNGVQPRVLDATAGLGRDAFVLASLGCTVQMIERHPVVAALLDNGLQRAYADPEMASWLPERLTLLHASSQEALVSLADDPSFTRPDVVYLDPMFPHKKKSALVKKEMRIFQYLVGADMDADDLLTPALALAEKRVVVKRPDYAAPLADKKPSMMIETKKNRFDVYVNAAMK